MRKLRLLFTKFCPRNCEGCCNHDWDLDKLEKVSHFDYDEILITGGEPMYFFDRLYGFLLALRVATKAKIYIYTARISNPHEVAKILSVCDGLTVTIHDKSDDIHYYALCSYLKQRGIDTSSKSLRLNVFKPSKITPEEGWVVKPDIVWREKCPLPEDEEFKTI